MVHLQVFQGKDSRREVDIPEINGGKERFGSGSSQWVIMVI